MRLPHLSRRDWIVFIVALMAVWVVIRGEVRQADLTLQGQESHSYLCYQKQHVIPARIASTIQYEIDVQLGRRRPIVGVTLADLEASVKRDQDVLRAMTRIHC